MSDLDQWKKWKETPTKKNLEPLLNDYNSVIMKRVNMFSGAEVPKPALITKGKILAVEAFKTYDPNKGSSLGTHVYTHLKRLSRFTGDLQNVGKIPENRRLKIQEYKNVKVELEEAYNREPTTSELAGILKWPLQEVARMESELRNSVVGSVFEGDRVMSDDQTKLNRIVKNIYYELAPDEQLVYEYLIGVGGKPRLNETQIAKQLNTSVTKVSRIKHKIAKKIRQWE